MITLSVCISCQFTQCGDDTSRIPLGENPLQPLLDAIENYKKHGYSTPLSVQENPQYTLQTTKTPPPTPETPAVLPTAHPAPITIDLSATNEQDKK